MQTDMVFIFRMDNHLGSINKQCKSPIKYMKMSMI